MPVLDLPPDLGLHHEIDDWTDPWTRSETILPTLVIATRSSRRSEAEMSAYREGLAKGELAKLPIDGYHAAGSAPDASAHALLELIERHRR